MGDHWSRLDLGALVTLALVIVATYAVATRSTAGCAPSSASANGRSAETGTAVAPRRSRDAWNLDASFVLATVGVIGLIVIIWLMLLKPF